MLMLNRFAIDDVNFAKHPFLVSSVLDPATKHLLLFSGELRMTAYAHVRSLMQPVIAGTMAGNPAGPPPSKNAKNDVRAAKLKFLSSATR